MKINFSSTLSKLIFLLFTFLFGIFSLISLHLVFMNLVADLDNKTKNLKAKIQIGEIISNDLYKIRSDFYELATSATNNKSRQIVKIKLHEKVQDIKNSLYILENGGTLKRTIRLNITGHHSTEETLHYNKLNDNISLEVIDIMPKLDELKRMVEKLFKLLEELEKNRKDNNTALYMESSKTIKRFYKSTPSFFIRITENTNRLLYEGSKELYKLEKQIEEEKEQYQSLELLLIAGIIFFGLILGYIIARQIDLNAKKLEHQEASTRGVLDGQPNIVIVSNGKEMLDANTTLIDFFDKYNSFEDFKDKHLCICDFFIDLDNDEYVIDKDYNGLKWFEYILENPKLLHKVAMYNDQILTHFSITAKKKVLDKDNFIVIISLNDISKEILAQRELKKVNDNLEELVNNKTKQLQELNESLELRIEKEVESSRQKDQKMIQQSRFAALGEMIGNIAHQWRQPLSAISSTASSMQVQMQLNLTNDEEITKSYTSIISYVQFLTQTIEDFRTFFKEDKEKTSFNMLDILNNTMTITNAVYKESNIEVIFNIEDKELLTFGLPNELSQVCLNILNNAKDALLESNVTKRYLIINAHKVNNNNIIEIQDNAGGIPENIITKIFDPYFTTKHQSQGTGIGLYMSKDILEKHMSGSLHAENKLIKIKDEEFMGASFTITLPILTIKE